MADAPAGLILIVTGSTLRAEEMDRPLAYFLKDRIESFLEAQTPERTVRVVADFRWIHDDPLQEAPTISLGGPGVNVLSHRWLEEVPVALAVDERYYLQMEPDFDPPRVSIWGMDNLTTQIAVSVFIDRYLARFLDQSAMRATSHADADDAE